MPLPPGSSAFPPAMAAAERRTYYVDQLVTSAPGNSGPRTTSGPFQCPRVPVSGTLEIPAGKGGQFVHIEEKVYFPLWAAVRARAILRDIGSNVTYEVVYVQRRSSFIEAWVKRAQPDI